MAEPSTDEDRVPFVHDARPLRRRTRQLRRRRLRRRLPLENPPARPATIPSSTATTSNSTSKARWASTPRATPTPPRCADRRGDPAARPDRQPPGAPQVRPARLRPARRRQRRRGCPADTQVGYLNASRAAPTPTTARAASTVFPNGGFAQWVPIYNLVPPKGTPVDLSFNVNGYVVGPHLRRAGPRPATTRSADGARHHHPPSHQHPRRRNDPLGRARRPRPRPLPLLPKTQEDGAVVGAPFGDKTIRPFFTNPSTAAPPTAATASASKATQSRACSLRR